MEKILQKEKADLDSVRIVLIELKEFISRAKQNGDAGEVDAREFYDKKIKLETSLSEYKSSNPKVQKGIEALRSQVVGFSLHLSEEKHLSHAISLLERLESIEKTDSKNAATEVEMFRALAHQSAIPGKGS